MTQKTQFVHHKQIGKNLNKASADFTLHEF